MKARLIAAGVLTWCALGYGDRKGVNMMKRWSGWGAVLLLILTAATARAQSTTGTVTGRIVDAQGLSIPGVTVTVNGPQGAKSTRDRHGRTLHGAVSDPGSLCHPRGAAGVQDDRSPDVQVRLGQTSDIPLTMEVGGVTENVTVVGAPTPVDATSTAIGGNLDTATLSTLPVGRRFSDALVPRARRQQQRQSRRRQSVRLRCDAASRTSTSSTA